MHRPIREFFHYLVLTGRFLATVLILLCGSCTHTKVPLPKNNVPSSVVQIKIGSEFHMDTTVGSYGAGREDRMILVTINKADHQQLIRSTSDTSQSENLPKKYADLMQSWVKKYGITRVADWPVPPLNAHCLIFETDGVINRELIVASLNRHAIVNTAEPVRVFSALQNGTYNDPYLPLQHAVRSMRVDNTHQWSTGRGVSVAVIDTGVDITHPEFAKRIQNSKNFVDSDNDQFLSDVHGTAVAGVIGAEINNGTGMVGIAPEVRLLPMKACWQNNRTDRQATCNSITLLKALDDSIMAGVDIINLSLAGPPDPLLEQLIAEAIRRNIIVVGARSPGNPNSFPAAVAGVIAVTDESDSTRGIIKAPGQKVLSLHPQNAYEFYNGRSFSTAHIAGIAALVRELAPTASAADIESLIRATADFSTGTANACRAISYMVKSEASVCEL